ncbi:hypothetical protein PG994_002923 [Apiospora phragmitis]|uniref:RRM domain-containing protein n=1 Tax=Apiospora phragmitis TaxID=2905665 RepID=A0ABR1W9D6_9PEZI
MPAIRTEEKKNAETKANTGIGLASGSLLNLPASYVISGEIVPKTGRFICKVPKPDGVFCRDRRYQWERGHLFPCSTASPPPPAHAWVRALTLAEYRIAEYYVNDRLNTMFTTYFNRMTDGKETIPLNEKDIHEINDTFVVKLHRAYIHEINDTFVAYKNSNIRERKFPERAFGILIALHCQARAWEMFEPEVDEALARCVATAAMYVFGRLNIRGEVFERTSFGDEDLSLFHFPANWDTCSTPAGYLLGINNTCFRFGRMEVRRQTSSSLSPQWMGVRQECRLNKSSSSSSCAAPTTRSGLRASNTCGGVHEFDSVSETIRRDKKNMPYAFCQYTTGHLGKYLCGQNRRRSKGGQQLRCCLLPGPAQPPWSAALKRRRHDRQGDWPDAGVTDKFGQWEAVFVKIRRDKKNMPYAFCQYTNDWDASKAMANGAGTIFQSRPCRVEMELSFSATMLAEESPWMRQGPRAALAENSPSRRPRETFILRNYAGGRVTLEDAQKLLEQNDAIGKLEEIRRKRIQ